MVKRFIHALLIFLSCFSALAYAELYGTVDRHVVSEGEVVNYTLRSDGQSFSGTPDLTPLKKDFDILNTRQSNQIRMINGRHESWTEWEIALMPRKVGAVTIPSIGHNGNSSNPITIEVRKGSSPDQGAPASSPVFMRSSIGADEVWQDQETILTLKIYTRANFSESPNLTPPDVDGAIFKILGEDQNEERIIDGMRYQIITRQYIVTPTRAGTLTIPGQVLTGSLVEEDPYRSRGSFFSFNRTRPFRISSPEMTLKVNPVPASWPEDKPWLPAEELTISESWSNSLRDLGTGDSITRTVTVRARGSNSAQIPPLPALNIPGIRNYPDQPKLDDKRDTRGSIGSRSESVAIVPTQAGTIRIPAIEVDWFNTRTGEVEISRLDGQTIRIQAKADEPAAPVAQIQPESTTSIAPPASGLISVASREQSTNDTVRFWQIATTVFALLWLITLVAWWRKRPSPAQKPSSSIRKPESSERHAFHRLLSLCTENNLPAVEQALVNWGRRVFQQPELYQASVIILQLNSSRLQELWDSLQKGRYHSQKQAISTAELIPALKQARTSLGKRNEAVKANLMAINP